MEGMIWKDPLEIIGVQDSKVQPINKVGRNTTVPSHVILDWACSGHYVILFFVVFVSLNFNKLENVKLKHIGYCSSNII